MSRPWPTLLSAACHRLLPPALLGAVLLFAPTPTSADTGSVQVTAAVQSRIILTIGGRQTAGQPGTTSATLPLSLDHVAPDGTGAGGDVRILTGASPEHAVFYVWAPAEASRITVRTNRPWSGTISARENAGTARNVRVAGGALRFHTSAPDTADAAARGAMIGTTPGAWVTDGGKGITSALHSFSVRVRPGDGAGSFNTVITYSVSQ